MNGGEHEVNGGRDHPPLDPLSGLGNKETAHRRDDIARRTLSGHDACSVDADSLVFRVRSVPRHPKQFFDDPDVGSGARPETFELEFFVGGVHAVVIETEAHENGLHVEFGL